jgi:hypothetical protein
VTYRLYGIRPGEREESLVWEDRLLENCAALMGLESVRGGREMRIETVPNASEVVRLDTKDTGAKVDASIFANVAAKFVGNEKRLYSLARRSQTGDKLQLVHTEVYEGLERAKKAAKDLEQASEFKYVVFELGTVQ